MRTFLIKSRNGKKHDWRVNRGQMIKKHERWTYVERIGPDNVLPSWIKKKTAEGMMSNHEANDIHKILEGQPDVTYIRLSPEWNEYTKR
jgi:hypothetical protein